MKNINILCGGSPRAEPRGIARLCALGACGGPASAGLTESRSSEAMVGNYSKAPLVGEVPAGAARDVSSNALVTLVASKGTY